MSSTHVVVFPQAAGDPGETLAQRVHRLQAEARASAKLHVELLRQSLEEVARLAAEIADGGEAYPVGAREMSRRLQDDAAAQALTLAAITDRL